jgi:hypothetical protein
MPCWTDGLCNAHPKRPNRFDDHSLLCGRGFDGWRNTGGGRTRLWQACVTLCYHRACTITYHWRTHVRLWYILRYAIALRCLGCGLRLLMRLGKVGNFFTYRPSLYHFFPTFLVNIARYCATHAIDFYHCGDTPYPPLYCGTRWYGLCNFSTDFDQLVYVGIYY